VLSWTLQQTGDFHLIFDIVSGVAVVAGSYGAWMVKALLARIELNQAKVKAELLEHQNSMKDEVAQRHGELLEGQHDLRAEFAEKHAENRHDIDVHTAEDRQKFEGISRTLNRMEIKLDKIANGH
jgi:hypothetical protein